MTDKNARSKDETTADKDAKDEPTGERIEWTLLDIQLQDKHWTFMNFKTKVRTDTNLIVIKNLLKRRHGPITDIVICKEEFLEFNELGNGDGDMKTLKDFGIEGGPKDDAPSTTLYYDYKPADFMKPDPLLLS